MWNVGMLREAPVSFPTASMQFGFPGLSCVALGRAGTAAPHPALPLFSSVARRA